MFTTIVKPRFYETDAFGHVNNTVVTGWFETAREPIFQIFATSKNPASLPLILARIEVDFVAQIYYGDEVRLTTAIERIGNSSFVVLHEAWQNEQCVARGKAVQVYFDHQAQKSNPLPEPFRQQLAEHQLPVG